MSILSGLERSLLERLLCDDELAAIEVELWNGEVINSSGGSSNGSSVVRLVIRKRSTLLKLLADPDLQFGDCYASGELDIRGDMVALMSRVYDSRIPLTSLRARIRGVIARRHRRISRRAAERNARHHYDAGNDFFALWLDPTMTYTCAYFADDQVFLEAAQRAKMDMVCRKLELRPQQRVVEAGCGWGSLAIHMAQVYGVSVDAYNVSAEQVCYARSRVDQEGLGDRVRIHQQDYRDIRGSFDAFVSLGLLEHVGLGSYADLGRVIRRSLLPEGRGLIQSIGRNQAMPTHPWISKRIFPHGYAPSVEQMSAVFEPNQLSVLDVANLRPHYAQTLEHWSAAFDQHWEQICGLVGEYAARRWRLYLAAANAGFRSDWLQLFQVVFAHNHAIGALRHPLPPSCATADQ